MVIYPVPFDDAYEFPLPNKYPSITSTTHVADFFPSEFFTVIVAVPDAFAVTSPVSFTVATSVLLLVHCTFSVVSAGFTVAVNCAVWLTSIFLLVGLTSILVIDVLITIVHWLLHPLSVFTVIVVLPFPFTANFPLSTATTLVLLLDHVIFVFTFALSGNIVAFNVGLANAFFSNIKLE